MTKNVYIKLKNKVPEIRTYGSYHSTVHSVNNAVVLLGTKLSQQTLQMWRNKDVSFSAVRRRPLHSVADKDCATTTRK